MHDFAITENYTIFMDLPLTFRRERLEKGEPALMFESELPSRFGILPRHGNNSDISWFESPACYVFHTLNAYESGEEVILIACRMNGTTVLGSSNVSRHSNDVPHLYRWRFNLSSGAVVEEALDDISSEFPRVNEQYLGRPTRYGYTARTALGSMPQFNGLIKYDLFTGTSATHYFGPGRYGGEGVFVPSGTGIEDDGWLLTFVYDEVQETSELVLVNAMDMSSEPVARIIIPNRVPYGFHGTWIGYTV